MAKAASSTFTEALGVGGGGERHLVIAWRLIHRRGQHAYQWLRCQWKLGIHTGCG
jgi:hypothetical protein